MRKTLLSIAVCCAAFAAAPAIAHNDAGGDYSSGGGSSWTGSGGWGSYGGDRPERAVSYINPDTGAATANPDVAADSSCASPDRYDVQKLSSPGTANRNVHNDACFFGSSYRSGDVKLDAPATYQSSGVGFISACPDPDGAGPKFAVLSDTNGDGRNDRCFQSGSQNKNAAGDMEFHARLNNTTTAGRQSVTWCYDADQNGCSDEYVRDTIRIDWTQ